MCFRLLSVGPERQNKLNAIETPCDVACGMLECAWQCGLRFTQSMCGRSSWPDQLGWLLAVGEEWCGEVLGKSGSVREGWCRDMLGESGVETCWGRVV